MVGRIVTLFRHALSILKYRRRCFKTKARSRRLDRLNRQIDEALMKPRIRTLLCDLHLTPTELIAILKKMPPNEVPDWSEVLITRLRLRQTGSVI